jgi:hypothetical protein
VTVLSSLKPDYFLTMVHPFDTPSRVEPGFRVRTTGLIRPITISAPPGERWERRPENTLHSRKGERHRISRLVSEIAFERVVFPYPLPLMSHAYPQKRHHGRLLSCEPNHQVDAHTYGYLYKHDDGETNGVPH